LAEGPSIVGFSVTHPNYLFTRYVARRIKEIRPEIYIIFGGILYCYRAPYLKHIAQWHRDELPFVDCIVKNEGEASLSELVGSLGKGKRPEFCAGTTLRVGNAVVDCGERPLITDIDSLPFPDFSDFKKEDYLGDYIRIITCRGCVGRCVFCNDNYQMRVRIRKPQSIVQEIKLRISQGYRRFQSCDLILNPDVHYLEELCESIIREDLGIEFVFGQLRHAPGLSRKTFSLLKRSGFDTICFGSESGSQKILDLMQKNAGLNVMAENIKDAYSEGLKVILFFIVGFPGENEQTFQESLSWIKANARYISAVKHVAPLVVNWGTSIYEDLERYGIDEGSTKDSAHWKTKDGTNTHLWRMDLSRRMVNHLRELGIPLSGFMGENPIVPHVSKK
jgi:anaerobic magnesium-protoporphyrin IX monomethyl ester cyclase